MADLVLHTLSVGGGLLALSSIPGGTGQYQADMSFIREWRPSLVMSLTTRAELVEAKADTFGADVRSSAAIWEHVPITDYSTPDQETRAQWDKIGPYALRVLNGRGRVLVHCKGGCGRSGMIVLRLMILAGEDAVGALLRLRKIRPCAIETDAQMRWAVTGLSQES